jgi:RNase H-fold protein (predicted Holliday junction resolvase)
VTAILGVDPGMRKAGYAFLAQDGRVLDRGIESVERLLARLSDLCALYPTGVLAMGAGTNAAKITAVLAPLGLETRLVDERETTLRARSLYYAENPPRGLQRLLPPGLRFPPRPIDDYAAEIIALRLLERDRGKAAAPS